MTVGLEGRVEKVALEAEIEPRLDAAAVAAVKRWRFEPKRVGSETYTECTTARFEIEFE